MASYRRCGIVCVRLGLYRLLRGLIIVAAAGYFVVMGDLGDLMRLVASGAALPDADADDQ